MDTLITSTTDYVKASPDGNDPLMADQTVVDTGQIRLPKECLAVQRETGTGKRLFMEVAAVLARVVADP